MDEGDNGDGCAKVRDDRVVTEGNREKRRQRELEKVDDGGVEEDKHQGRERRRKRVDRRGDRHCIRVE